MVLEQPFILEKNIANLTNSFPRSDGGNTAIEAIDMNSNIINNCIRGSLLMTFFTGSLLAAGLRIFVSTT